MMPRVRNFWSIAAAMLLLLGSVEICRAQVAALGTKDSYWISRTVRDSTGAVHSFIQFRAVNSASPWRSIAEFSTPVFVVAARGTDLAAMQANGDWMVVWPGGSAAGTGLRDGARLIGLSSAGTGFWGVAEAQKGNKPTTMGATQPSASMPVGRRLLYQLKQGEWEMVCSLPDSVQDCPVGLTDDNGVLLLMAMKEDVLSLFHFEQANANWTDDGKLPLPKGTDFVNVIGSAGRTMLWAADRNQVGSIWWKDGDKWGEPTALQLPAGQSGAGAKDIAIAGGAIRLLVQGPNQLTEYSYDLNGTPAGSAVIPLMMPDDGEDGVQWMSVIGAAALVFVLMNSSRRPILPTRDMLATEGIVVAPIFRRLMAGTIDALPLIGTFIVVWLRLDPNAITFDEEWTAIQYPLYAAIAIYMLHTLVCELLWGWTIGKRIFGLRVMMIDGTPPTRRAIVLRNLLRALDAATFGASLLIVLLSPLWQRIGDMVAETIVVKETGSEPTKPADPTEPPASA